MRVALIYCFLLLMLSCQASYDKDQRKYHSPKGYDLAKPTRYTIRESMQEISGLVYYNGHFIGHNDEEGRIYEVILDTDRPYRFWKFAKSGDYEEMLLAGKDWFVVKSNGKLYQVHNLFTDSTSSTEYHFPHKGKNEFEAAYLDSTGKAIVLLCKNCEADKGKSHTSTYRFNLETYQYEETDGFRISTKEISRIGDYQFKNFRPSAAAVHPIEKRVYVVASLNRLLVIMDFQGNVQEVYHLRGKNFKQPEGITFAPNGDMYISNEATEETMANILKFTYHPSR
ncbi:hypothetical protein LX64_03160 [Chitinophaga skermanii]|uniref:SdiA-regulated protein n=1 Tax=Chitinophaga skermanii TaxID=331697 RepID=A0A327QIV2_9BACT|nr:hypothetical protein [Chitinophaga skermanii]RAJ04280.1 hypothetical protein LX64_03160 [Chitinophaga skermanii]